LHSGVKTTKSLFQLLRRILMTNLSKRNQETACSKEIENEKFAS